MAHPLIPLLILVIVVLAAAVVGYVVYSIATDISEKTQSRMQKHNVSVGKDGVKIGLKELKDEDYVAKTQNIFVKAWNYSSWPAYQSRFWNKPDQAAGQGHSSSSKQAHQQNTLHKRKTAS